MSAPAIISGDFSTFRHVQGRKVLQLVIEIPAEQAASVFSTFGYPGAGSPIPVAVAKLVEPAPKTAGFVKNRRTFGDLPLAQQAAMRCQEPTFRLFLIETNRMDRNGLQDDWDAAEAVRKHCGVKSRSDIGKDPGDGSTNDSGFRWRSLDAEYFAWQRGHR